MLMRDYDRHAEEASEDGTPDVCAVLVGMENVDRLAAEQRHERRPGDEIRPRPPIERDHANTGGAKLVVERLTRRPARCADDRFEPLRIEPKGEVGRKSLGAADRGYGVDQGQNPKPGPRRVVAGHGARRYPHAPRGAPLPRAAVSSPAGASPTGRGGRRMA